MYNGQTISLKSILWTVLRNPLASELTYEEAAGFAIEALRLLGSPLVLEDKITDPLLTILDYKAALPSDLLQIRGARIIIDTENYERGAIPLRYATDIYHTGLGCSSTDETNCVEEFTYTTQKGIIYTSMQDGALQVSYKGLTTDEEGFPLIPNDQKVIMALEYYVLFRYLEPLWMVGKITDKAFGYIDTKKCFYMPSAGNAMKLQGIDQLESVMNSINRLIVNTQAYTNFYKGSGEKERLKRFN